MLRRHLPSLSFVAVLTTLVAIGAAVFIYLGVYDVAADQPHTRPVFALLETLRDRSITVRARGIKPPPDLDAPERVRIGAGLYGEMCSGCHLGPGVEQSEMSQGLYPRAPELAKA